MNIDSHHINGAEGTFIIAEIAQAHDGSLGQAHSFIDAVADSGANAIKFQTHIANAESTLDEPFRVPLSGQDATRWDYWRRMEFSREQWLDLSAHAKQRGLTFLSSAFSEEAVRLLAEIGMPAWKVGSGEAFNLPLIDLMIEMGGPILLSTGMSTWEEINETIEHISKKGGTAGLLQCTTKYPTPLEEVGLNILTDMKSSFDLPVGLSDHSGTPWPALAAMAASVDILELHVTFDKRMFGPDTTSSINFSELSMLCQANNAFAKMRANPIEKDKAASELLSTKALFTKSLSPLYDLPAGIELSKEMLTLKKPSGGLTLDDLGDVIGKRLNQPLPANRLLKKDHLE